MPPHTPTYLPRELELTRLKQQLLVRKFQLIVWAKLFLVALLLLAVVPDSLQKALAIVTVFELQLMLWGAWSAWRIARKIQRLKGGLR